VSRPDGDRAELSRQEVRRRASAGLFSSLSWGVVSLALGFVGSLALARLVTPEELGIVAVGSTVLLIVTAFADGGLGAGLIRRAAAPTEAELRTLTGVQLAFTLLITAVIAVIAPRFGPAGQVAAVMTLAMPISSLQSAPRVVMLRQLRVRQVAAIEAGAIAGYYIWAIAAVGLGWGVWGLATGTVFRAVCLVGGAAVVAGGGLRRPTLELVGEFRALFAFGVKFQVTWVIAVLRDQARIVATGAAGSFALVGVWSLSGRVLSLPALLFSSIERVWFPTISHYIASGTNPRELLERVVSVAAAAAALLLSPFVAAAPAMVILLFGERWADVGLVIPGGALSLMVAGPTVVACLVGYLFAADLPGAVLRAALVSAIVGVAAAVPFILIGGAFGLGMSVALEGLVETVLLARATYVACGARVLRPLIAPLAVGATAAAVGWLVSIALDPLVVGGTVGALVALSLTALGLMVVSRTALLSLWHLALRSVGDATGLRWPVSSRSS
jgi:O-antigen/teichoic acid export membrane protein